MKTILIIGSSSAIAQATARQFATQNHRLILFARNGDFLQRQQSDLKIRGAEQVETFQLDINDIAAQRQAISQLRQTVPTLDAVLICHGSLPDQEACADDYEKTLEAFTTNALSTIALLSQLAPLMRAQGHGCLAVITSVAGDRGRASNYVYGAAKSLVSRYLEGLRASLFRQGVSVLDIRPGFIDSPMTSAFRKGLLWSTPEQIAPAIVRAMERGRSVVYTPWYWRGIMLVIRSIPEFLFKRMKL